MKNLMEELMRAALVATEERRTEALRILRDDAEQKAEVYLGSEPYLTLREIGRRLNFSPCSLWRWQVPGHEMGGRRRFRLSEVQAYLDSDEFKQRAEELKQKRKTKNDKIDAPREEKS